MVRLQVLRDSVSLVLSIGCYYVVFSEHEASMRILLYLFLFFFGLDFHLQKKLDFRVHHVIGATLCLYAIYVPVSIDLLTMVFAVELSTPLLLAIKYLPEDYTPFIKMLFVGVFYYTRLQSFGTKLLFYNIYGYPYSVILVAALWALFALSLFWFAVILKKIPQPARVWVFRFVLVSLFLQYHYY